MRSNRWAALTSRNAAVVLASALGGALLISSAIYYPMILLSPNLGSYNIEVEPAIESFVSTLSSSFWPIATFTFVGSVQLLLVLKLRAEYRYLMVAGPLLGAAMLVPLSFAFPWVGVAILMGALSGLLTALCWIAAHKMLT